MSLRIEQIKTDLIRHRQDWQAYVQASAQATFYHTRSWLDAVEMTFPHQAHHLIAYRGDQPVGVFPLYAVRSFLAGKILVSIPYAVYGGPLVDDAEVAEAFLEELTRLAKRTQARYVDIRSRRVVWELLPKVDRYATFSKTLPDRVEDVLGSFPRKARAEARKARDRFRLRERFDSSQLRLVWELYSRSMRRLGSPNVPYKFFQALAKAAPQQQVVLAVYCKEAPMSGLLSFVFRDTILPYYSGCVEAIANSSSANNMLYLALMEKAVELGLKQFDFGRTRIDNKGSFEFKKNQGFLPTPLGYQFYLPQGGQIPNLTPSNRKFYLAQWVWRHLPLSVTRPLGSWVSASIPG